MKSKLSFAIKSSIGITITMFIFKCSFFNKKVLSSQNNVSKFDNYYDSLWRSKIRKNLMDEMKKKGIQDDVVIIQGSANKNLSNEISNRLQIPIINTQVTLNKDEELLVSIKDNLEGKVVYIIQPMSPPINNNFLEVLFLVSEAKRKGAKKVCCVFPYIGYSTVTYSFKHNYPINSADIAKMLEVAGANSCVTIDLHEGQIEGFYNIPIDNIDSNIILTDYIYNSNIISDFENLIVISPDVNGVKRAKSIADLLANKMEKPINIAFLGTSFNENHEFAKLKEQKEIEIKNNNGNIPMYEGFIEKINKGKKFDKQLIGNVEGMDCLIVDDIVKSGSTLINSAEELKKNGAKNIYVYVTHSKFF